MLEKFEPSTQENGIRGLNAIVKGSIEAGQEYFPQNSENLDHQQVKLKMTKGTLQTLMSMNRSVLNASYGTYREKSQVSFKVREDDWNNFATGQLLASTELRKTISDALFKNSPPLNSKDWENFNEKMTEVTVTFGTAKSLIQTLAGFMELSNLEIHDSNVKKYSKEYYQHILARDKKMKCIKSLLSQLADQGLSIGKYSILALNVIENDNRREVEDAKIVLEHNLAQPSSKL